ncbi:hypothetical protein C2E20_7498 [Micractinium conductrix]|uniref:PWWP domain-containing protein n=1 Tax=Micractinium conductrix TaxID=554055 RepID=A0A2P6V4J4_9CHLO|nr:hypothetical protein C2E20_7498 [Micractinium conductrix]|eukprot:PSC68989.1 hypothetical protein C2E20_7498 [Micractinium conductrix]
MPATPATGGRRRQPAASPRQRRTRGVSHPLQGTRVLVPPAVFPKEKVARGFPGWPAAVVGAEVEERADGLHLVVEFESYSELYHFPESKVREWTVVAQAGGQADAAPAARLSTARRAAATSGHTPSRRSAAAAAKVTARDLHYSGRDEQQQHHQQQQPAALGVADTPAADEQAAAAGVSSPSARTSTRKRRPEPEAVFEQQRPRRPRQEAAEQEQQQQQPEGGEGGEVEKVAAQAEAESWLGKAGGALLQGAVTAAAACACYTLLSALYPYDTLG